MKVAAMRPASLDAPISDDDSTEFGEIVGDENAVNPAKSAAFQNAMAQVPGLLEVLDVRELKIIEARFGLNGQKTRTLEEVGQELGVTRERIRQLQNIALRKLRRALQKKEDPIPKPLKGARKKKQGPMKTSVLTRDVHSMGLYRKYKHKDKADDPLKKTRHHYLLDDEPADDAVSDEPQRVVIPEKPRTEFLREVSDKASFDAILAVLSGYLHDVGRKAVLRSVLTYGFSPLRLRQEIEKIKLDEMYIA